MDFYLELFLTALISVLIAFLIGKIAAAGEESDDGDRPEVSADLKLRPIKEEEGEEEKGDSRGVEVEDRGDRSVEDRSVEEKESGVDEAGLGEVFVKESSEAVENPEIERIDEEEKGGSLLHGEDEWEGIERSELGGLFDVAAKYVGSEGGEEAVAKLSNELQMQLYGLHKVATEGPCYEPQPMALKLSARAKWHAWQRLGNMNPEVAMDQYVALLSQNIPGWMIAKAKAEFKPSDGNDTPVTGMSQSETCDSSSVTLHHPPTVERLSEDTSSTEADDKTIGQKLSTEGLTKTFLFNLLSPARVTFLTFFL